MGQGNSSPQYSDTSVATIIDRAKQSITPTTEKDFNFPTQPHELTVDWSDHQRAKDFNATKDDKYKWDTSGRNTYWGNAFSCNVAATTNPSHINDQSCAPNEDGTMRDNELTAGYFLSQSRTQVQNWRKNPLDVNQDPTQNPWGARTPLEAGCMPYGISPSGHNEYACPIEFIAHGWDWKEISDATSASKAADGSYNRSKQTPIPCPKGYVWVENGGIHYKDPNGRLPPSEMLAAICAEDKKIFDPTKPVKPTDDTPAYGPDAPVDKPLPPIIGGDCQAFLKSNNVNNVTCMANGKLPDPTTDDGKKWWDGYDKERIKEQADQEGQKDADAINYFHYQPNLYAIGGGAAASGLLYYNSPQYNLTTWLPLLGAPVVDAGYQYMSFKLWRAEDEMNKIKDYVIAGGIAAGGLVAPPFVEYAIGLPTQVMSTVNLALAAAGIAGGLGYLVYQRGFSVFSFL